MTSWITKCRSSSDTSIELEELWREKALDRAHEGGRLSLTIVTYLTISELPFLGILIICFSLLLFAWRWEWRTLGTDGLAGWICSSRFRFQSYTLNVLWTVAPSLIPGVRYRRNIHLLLSDFILLHPLFSFGELWTTRLGRLM
jgi:hypothetical protein